MLSEFDRESLRSLLTDAIKLMCKNSLTYRTEFTIEGLLGITLDKTDVFLVNIAESIKSNDSEQHTQLAEQDSILVDDGEQYLEPQPPRPNNRAPLSVETTALCELPGSTSKRKMDNNDQMNYKRAKAMQITPLQQNNTADVLNLVENDSRERLPPKDIKIEINEDYEESDNVVKVELDEDGDIHRSDIPNISGNFDKLEESTETSEDFLAGLGRSLDFSGEFSAHPHLNESNSAQKKKKPVPKKQMSPSGRYACQFCDKTFNKSGTRVRHMATVHKIGKPLQCPFCATQNNGRKDNMRKHLRTVHGLTSTSGIQCPTCNAIPPDLLEHVMSEHIVNVSVPAPMPGSMSASIPAHMSASMSSAMPAPISASQLDAHQDVHPEIQNNTRMINIM